MSYEAINQNLRLAGLGTSDWSEDQIKAGFKQYKNDFGHFPSTHEIDAYKYLPSSRSIQRSFGGLVKLRKRLFPDEIHDHTKGTYRAAKAKKSFSDGRNFEDYFYNYLIGSFKEIAVHEQKIVRPGHVRSDFYIYLNDKIGIVIDIFYAASIINLINVVNIKLKRYSSVSEVTYLVVVGNDDITQEAIDRKVANRKVALPEHIYIVSELEFKNRVLVDLKGKSEFALL